MESSNGIIDQQQVNRSGQEEANMLLTQPAMIFGNQKQKKTYLDENNKYGKEIERDYNKLQDIIDNLQNKVDKIIKSQEDDFMIAYKEQMSEIQKELKAMKRKIDEEALRQKADEKKRILEEERDYFREEALRLDKLCQEQLRTIEELKFKLKITNEEKNYYEGFVIDSKKENKALKYELLQLYKHKMDEQKNQVQPRLSSVGIQQRTTVINRPSTQEAPQMDFHSGIKDDLFGNDISKREQSSKQGQKTMLSAKFGDLQSTQHEFFRRECSSQQISRNNNNNLEFQNLEEMLKIQKEQLIELQKQIQREKTVNQQLKGELSKQNCQRGELETILLECVNDMKKEIASRQNQQRSYLNSKPSENQIELQDVNFKQFTHSDKKLLLKKFLSTEEFLESLYQITFHSSIQSTSVTKLNEKWKRDAQDASKKFNHFKTYKFKNISSQPILKQTIQKKDIASSYNNFSDKTRGLLEKIINS